tara:strand:+ start:87 stop:551 length:465 start_codon:yes stop_codon:yes gene_type:complete
MRLNIILTLILIFVTNCGYKVVNQSYFDEYKIDKLNISGDKKINYLLRNKLKWNNKDYSKSINLDITNNKVKNIKEKNIQNNITKYEILITVNVNFSILGENKSGQFVVQRTGNYSVGGRHGITLSNEKKLVNNMVEEISEEIFKSLALSLYDL